MILGREGIHQWTSADGVAIEINRVKDDSGDPVHPYVKLRRVGTGSLGDAEDNRSGLVGATGEVIRTSQARGRTVPYEGVVRARNARELREYQSEIRQAFSNRNQEGRMDVIAHPLNPSWDSGESDRFFNARVLALEMDDNRSSRRYESTFVLALRLSNPRTYRDVTPTAYSRFSTEAGNISGDSLAVGGTWSGAGDTDDFTVSGGLATRAVDGDSGTGPTGRAIVASGTSALTTTTVVCDFKTQDPAAGDQDQQLIARWGSTTSYIRAGCEWESNVTCNLTVKRPAATIETLNVFTGIANDIWWTQAFVVDTAGNYWLFFGPRGEPTLRLSGTESTFATAGSEADGSAGIYDRSDLLVTRTYDNFAVFDEAFSAGVPVSQPNNDWAIPSY